MTALDAALVARQRAGYRVLRSLARDADAELLLGFLPGPDDGQPTTVVIKVFPATPGAWPRVIAEVEALGRARGEHVVELHDVDADETGIGLVFERLPRGDLAELLRIRDRLDGGEAVTLLAPIASTMLRMHEAGVAHGALGVRTVLFRADGAATIIGFGHAEVFEPEAPEVALERLAAVIADRDAVRAIAIAVLGRVAAPRARAARELIAQLTDCSDEALLPFLASQIFELAAAVPLRFTADANDETATPSSTGAVRVVPVGEPVSEQAVARSNSTLARMLTRLVPESWAQRLMDAVNRSPVTSVLQPVVATAIGRWRGWSGRRRRVALACAAAVVTITVAMTVLPAPGAPTQAAGVSRPRSTSAPAPGPAAAASSSASKKPSPSVGAEFERAVRGNDPLAAAAALVHAREGCLAALSVLCLDDVDHLESGALRDDRAAIRAAQQGGELPVPLVRDITRLAPVLVERLGDSALVRLTEAASSGQTPSPDAEPASLLLVKGEAGWRIRDVIAAEQNSG